MNNKTAEENIMYDDKKPQYNHVNIPVRHYSWLYVSFLSVFVVVVVACAYFFNAFLAVRILSVFFGFHGFIVMFFPSRYIPYVRSRWFDGAASLLFCVILFYLAPWALAKSVL
ncbi:MAG: hypothetical protein J6M18_06245 [Actinomycetaceae bacterium]|nr:hypothetical protein [Actinomycetaceae bacterium]